MLVFVCCIKFLLNKIHIHQDEKINYFVFMADYGKLGSVINSLGSKQVISLWLNWFVTI